MNAIVTLLQFVGRFKTVIVLLVGLAVGVAAGVGLGWYAFPVEWTNATPGELRRDFRDEYLVFVARHFEGTGEVEDARTKLLGSDHCVGQQGVVEALDELAERLGGEDVLRLRALAQALRTAPPVSPAATCATGAAGSVLGSTGRVCGVGLLVLALVVGVVYLAGRVRSARGAAGAGRAAKAPVAMSAEDQVRWGSEGVPVARFPTTYTMGDDHYDPSFSIELDDGEFLGECGVGVSETIGVGAPSKVTAFEVWLFDKNDIRTVTKVLMSDYAFHDEALRAKLAPKGEAVLVTEGEDVLLETKTLRVRARAVEARYGESNLPPDSFFERLTIDLAAWVKPGTEEELDEFAELSSLE